ncbi:unnamed protein product [Adineta ricciae]|uniref:Uncharacterized protein n=1 Tax=Adineta ricciae TaxID=249248 RepID=A0A814QYH1_ADIRI|nr:unnamed protein product [Adineta ricciae]
MFSCLILLRRSYPNVYKLLRKYLEKTTAAHCVHGAFQLSTLAKERNYAQNGVNGIKIWEDYKQGSIEYFQTINSDSRLRKTREVLADHIHSHVYVMDYRPSKNAFHAKPILKVFYRNQQKLKEFDELCGKDFAKAERNISASTKEFTWEVICGETKMYADDEHRRYGDSTRLEPIVEQQDDEMITTPTSISSLVTDHFDEERRVQEEIRQFEELEKELVSNRRGIRVKFDENDLYHPSPQTTVVRTEPCFQVNSCEDQVTKHFYANEYQLKINEKTTQSKTPSEPDSLDDECLMSFEEPTPQVIDRNTSSPTKSILKKSSAKDQLSVPDSNVSSRSRSPSPTSSSSSLKKTLKFSTPSQSNQVQHLAGVTAKQSSCQSPPSCRSLFEPTINIFDSCNDNTRRPSRLRYYIKPYRGDTYIRPNITKPQSRSLSEQRFSYYPEPTVWYTFANQYSRPLNRRQHVSWSPVREYIHQGRDKLGKVPTKKKEVFLSPLSNRSSSNPCLRSSLTSMIPISIRYRSPQILCPPSVDSYETSSMTNYSLTPTSQYEEKQEVRFSSNSSDHIDTIQRYDRLLEKMRATDEQLKRLSRSWAAHTPLKVPNRSNLTATKSTNNKELISPMIFQVCLIIIVVFNLLAVYYFNEINILWNRFAAHRELHEQLDEEMSTFE